MTKCEKCFFGEVCKEAMEQCIEGFIDQRKELVRDMLSNYCPLEEVVNAGVSKRVSFIEETLKNMEWLRGEI